MKKINHNSGFTLIEIIVVLIIIGILAAIALPNLFSNVQKSRGSSAIAAIDGVKTAIEACAAQGNATPTAGTCDPVSFGLPSTTSATAPFGYTVINGSGSPAGANLTYVIQAEDTSGNTIQLTRQSSGTFSCSAGNSGPYANAC